MKRYIFFLIIFISILSFNFSEDLNTQEIVFEYSQNYYFYQSKSVELRETLTQLRDEGFELARLGDEIFVYNQLLENNKLKEMQNEVVSYQRIDEKLKQINDIIYSARLANDELLTFKIAIDEVDKEIDISSVLLIYEEAQQEFKDQRYEQVIKLVESGYSEIINLQSVEARTSAIAQATTRNLAGFLRENWLNIIFIIGIPVLIYIIFRKKIKLYFYNKKLNTNNEEINILKNELKKAQQDYFIKGNLSENDFQIKVNIYSEKIRELNRSNAIINEDIAALFKNQKMKKHISDNKKFNKKID